MDVTDCRTALTALDRARRPKRIERIEGGWSFWTFEADAEIVRFPRTVEDAWRLEREFGVLPTVAGHLAVSVPGYVARGAWGGMPFGVYPIIPGRSVTAGELLAGEGKLAAELGVALRALHRIPLDEIEAATCEAAGPGAWWTRKLAFLDECRDRAFPLLPLEVRDAAEGGIRHADGRAASVRATFAHNDLGLVHVLTDGERLTGIIDWSDAEVTDPAIDFVGVLGAGGVEAVEAVLRGYGEPPGDAFWERLWFLAWVAPLHDILYGLDTGDNAIVADGVAGVEARMRGSGLV